MHDSSPSLSKPQTHVLYHLRGEASTWVKVRDHSHRPNNNNNSSNKNNGYILSIKKLSLTKQGTDFHLNPCNSSYKINTIVPRFIDVNPEVQEG